MCCKLPGTFTHLAILRPSTPQYWETGQGPGNEAKVVELSWPVALGADFESFKD